jgi:hypothetical protein
MRDRDDAVRILIAYEDSHRSYGQTMAGALRGLRPVVETAVVQVRELEAEVGRFDPHVVVCNRPNTVEPGGRLGWVRLSDEPDETSEFCLAGQRWGAENPGLEEVLAFIDETERLLRTGRALEGC